MNFENVLLPVVALVENTYLRPGEAAVCGFDTGTTPSFLCLQRY